MKVANIFILLVFVMAFFNACKDDADVDTEKPSIDLTVEGAFPTSCDTIYFGKPFTLKVLLTDNAQLGAYNIDIHNNFDQHTHSTESETCPLEQKKMAINPYIFIQDYEIPKGLSEFTTSLQMTIPKSDGTDLYDEGDYHFQIRLTDKEGWSTIRGLSVKLLHQ